MNHTPINFTDKMKHFLYIFKFNDIMLITTDSFETGTFVHIFLHIVSCIYCKKSQVFNKNFDKWPENSDSETMGEATTKIIHVYAHACVM